MAFELPSMPNFQSAVPQQQSPLDQYGKMLQLKSLAGQQQLLPGELQEQQQKVQSNALAIQEQQQKLASRQAMVKAWSDPDITSGVTGSSGNAQQAVGFDPGFDPHAMIKKLVAKGVLPEDAIAQASSFLEVSKNLSMKTKDDLSNYKEAHEQLSKLLTPIMDMKASEAGAALASAKLQAARIPGIDPADIQHLQQADIEHLPALVNTLGFAGDLAGFHKSKAETGTAESEQQLKAQELGYHATLTKLLNHEKPTQEELASARAYEASQAKTTTQSDTLGVTSTNTAKPSGLAAAGARGGVKLDTGGGTGGGASGGGAGKPPSLESVKDTLVDQLGQYKADPQTLSRLMVKHPDLLALVAQKYPDWSQTSYVAKNKIVQSYTSGPESKSINAVSTALGHAGELGDAIEALNSTNGVNALRKLGQKLGIEILGNDKLTAYNTIVHRLAPEITAAYVQGGGGEHERMANENDFDASLGDAQKRANLGEIIKLLRSKIEAQEQQWNTTYMPTRDQDQFATRFLTPRAKQTLDKWSPQGGAGAAKSDSAAKPLTDVGKAREYLQQAGGDKVKARALAKQDGWTF